MINNYDYTFVNIHRLTPLCDFPGFWWRHFSGKKNRVWELAGDTFPVNTTDLGTYWRHFSGKNNRDWEPTGDTFPVNTTDLRTYLRHFSEQHHRLNGRWF